jgi:hypothetical protein
MAPIIACNLLIKFGFMVDFKLIEILILVIVIINSLSIILNIENKLKFTVSGVVFCPIFGSVKRCLFANLISFVCILSCLVLMIQLIQTNENIKKVGKIQKNKQFLIKAQIIMWIILLLLLFKWTSEVEAEPFQISRNVFHVSLNLGLFVGIFLFNN